MGRYKKGTGKKNETERRRLKGVQQGTRVSVSRVSVSTPAPLLEGEAGGASTFVSCPVSARSEWVVEQAAPALQKVLFPAQNTKKPVRDLRRSERAAVAAVPPAASPAVPPARSQVVVVERCIKGYRLSTPVKPQVFPKKGKSVGMASMGSTRSSTSRAKQAAHSDAVEVKDSDAQKKLNVVHVLLSKKSTVNPDPLAEALQGRAARKLFAGADLQPGTKLAYFYYKACAITEAVVFHPNDSGVELERDGNGIVLNSCALL